MAAMEGSRLILWVMLLPLIQLMPTFGQGRHQIIVSLQIRAATKARLLQRRWLTTKRRPTLHLFVLIHILRWTKSTR